MKPNIGRPALLILLTGVVACATVPDESVELSNTVGRDLEEVHRAHRALADLHFSRIEQDINHFIDETYRPAFIRSFAEEFKLDVKVTQVVDRDPDKLLPLLTRFVQVANSRIEAKRAELLDPIQTQKTLVISEIDAAHRQIQAAQAVVTGHLASVRKVREVQNESLAKAGLDDLRTKIATATADVSERVAGFVEKGHQIETQADSAAARVQELDAKIDEFKTALEQRD